MNKLSLFVLTIVLLAMASSRLASVNAQSQGANNIEMHAADGAYRDGLFLGRLDAGTRQTKHVSVGRWASEGDRALFRSGYEEGYRQASASVTGD